jgi:hypothetical protein
MQQHKSRARKPCRRLSQEQRFDETFDDDTVFMDIDPRGDDARLISGA